MVVKSKEQPEKVFGLTYDSELNAKEVANYYRRRWDIEFFFRFIDQELNVNHLHLILFSKNGIEVMIYMTLIAAMLLIYL